MPDVKHHDFITSLDPAPVKEGAHNPIYFNYIFEDHARNCFQMGTLGRHSAQSAWVGESQAAGLYQADHGSWHRACHHGLVGMRKLDGQGCHWILFPI